MQHEHSLSMQLQQRQITQVRGSTSVLNPLGFKLKLHTSVKDQLNRGFAMMNLILSSINQDINGNIEVLHLPDDFIHPKSAAVFLAKFLSLDN